MDGTVIGRVISKGVIPTRKGLRIFQAVVRDDSGMIEVSWPGQPFLDRVIHKDDNAAARPGNVRFFHGRQLPAARIREPRCDEDPTTRRTCAFGVSGHRRALVQAFALTRRRAPGRAASARRGLSACRRCVDAPGLRCTRRCAPDGTPPFVDRRGDARPRAPGVRGAVLRAAPAAARQRELAREARGGIAFTNQSDVDFGAARRRCRTSSPARRCTRFARSSQT